MNEDYYRDIALELIGAINEYDTTHGTTYRSAFDANPLHKGGADVTALAECLKQVLEPEKKTEKVEKVQIKETEQKGSKK